jgi:hypothetical protein
MSKSSLLLVTLTLSLSLAALPRHAGAVPGCAEVVDGYRGLFPATGTCGELDFPETTCEPNRRQDATFVLNGAAVVMNSSKDLDDRLTLTALCDVDLYDEIGLPPFTEPPLGQDWPVDLPNDDPLMGPEPDRGFRYPLLQGVTPADRQYQTRVEITPGDWWPVCVTAAGDEFLSDPGTDTCPESHHELGRCVAAGHYYEKMAAASRPAERFYSFVLSHRDCAPGEATEDSLGEFVGYCAHDVVSAVDACMRNCAQYFGSLAFDASAGKWDLASDLASPPAGAMTVHSATVPLETDHTILTQCRAICGPPYDDEFVCTDSNDLMNPLCASGDFTVHDTPPWTSKFSSTARTVAEKSNHWHFVQYGRGWNPNTNLDNWLRSYSVNRDKPYAPAGECVNLVNLYCDTQTPNEDACKERKLLDPTFDPRLPPEISQPDGFCGIFYRGSIVCPDTCHAGGGDADNPLPRNVCGDGLPADFAAAHDAAPEELKPAFAAYKNKFSCNGDARCQIAGCSASDLASTLCRTIGFVYPKKGTVAQGWSHATLEPMQIFLHTRFGEMVTEPAVQGSWELRTGGPQANQILVACGHFELDGKRFVPIQDEGCAGAGDFPLALEVGTVYRFVATMEAPDGSPISEFTKIKP